MEKRMNKKAQDLSVGTLILIVLGIIVLVLLILGFSLGWGNLWEKVNIFQGGSSMESVVSACNLAASSNQLSTFCDDFKQVKVNGEKQFINCQYTGLRLDKTLSCPTTEADLIKAQCMMLTKTNAVDQKTKVNGQTCWAQYTCDQLSGTLIDKASTCPPASEPGKTQKIDKALLNLASDKACCIVP